MRYHIVTLGCPKNTTDSARIARSLENDGHRATADRREADVVVLNTCGFIDDAKAESAQAAQQLAAEREHGQQLLVTGCWSQIEREQVQATVNVDGIFGIEAWDEIRATLGTSDATAERDIPAGGVGQSGQPSAYLKISDGCARPCTFCNIPQIKGRQFRSASPDALIAEARELTDRGARELVLVAQDSTAYAAEWGDPDGPARLLERLAAEVPAARWLRLMYAYPGFVTPSLIEAMASIPQVCNYLDIPLQHASVETLRRMKRPHNMRMVRETLERLRAAMPDIAIRTTFIVGFPGETKAEFNELLDFCREARFDRAGAFTYSPQPGTPAAELGGQLPERVKQRRYRRLMSVLEQIAAERSAEQVGRELELLVESEPGQTTEDGAPVFAGRSYREAPEVDGLVFCDGVASPGSMPTVRITQALGHDLWASPVAGEAHSLTGESSPSPHPSLPHPRPDLR